MIRILHRWFRKTNRPWRVRWRWSFDHSADEKAVIQVPVRLAPRLHKVICIEWHEAAGDSAHSIQISMTSQQVRRRHPLSCKSSPGFSLLNMITWRHGHMTTWSHDALPQRVRPLGSSSVRAQCRNVNDDVSPPHRVFGVIVVALVLRKVHKHLKHEKSSNENSEVCWKSQIKIRQV